MKNLFITAIIALGFIASSSAQDKGDVEFGVNVGYNSSSISSRDGSSESKSGFNTGLSADYYFSDTWSLKAKLIYDQKGWGDDILTDLDTGNEYITDFSLNYLTVPVMANWHFGRTQNWYLNFGPYVGFLLSAKEHKFDSDIKEAFNTTDFGLALGIGVKIPVSDKIKLYFEFDGQGGLSDIFKENESYRVQNSRSSINFGMNFLLK